MIQRTGTQHRNSSCLAAVRRITTRRIQYAAHCAVVNAVYHLDDDMEELAQWEFGEDHNPLEGFSTLAHSAVVHPV